MPRETAVTRSERRAATRAAKSTLQRLLQHSSSQDPQQSTVGLESSEIGDGNMEEECGSMDMETSPIGLPSEDPPDDQTELLVGGWDQDARSSESEDQSSSGADSSSDASDNEDLRDMLGGWGVKFNISHAAMDNLLIILRQFHPELPCSAKTVMHTPSGKVIVKTLSNGQYAHRGLFKGLCSRLQHGQLNQGCQKVTVDINIDGLSVFKNSREEMWSILGRSLDLKDTRPFVIGMFYGRGKPDPIQDYLGDFINDVKELQRRGLVVDNVNYECQINKFICDAPARAYIKCCMGHASTNGCERCEEEGDWDGHVIYPLTRGVLRTDDSFTSRRDPSHHHNTVSPLESDLEIKCISQIVLDIMHLRDLGIVSRFLDFVTGRAPPISRMSAHQCRETSRLLLLLKPFISSEFGKRGPRELRDLGKWKATEFRSFVLYIGIVVLQSNLREEVYELFLLLHAAMYILSNDDLLSNHLDNAETFLTNFVEYSAKLFGREFVSYNVHSLLHLGNEVRLHGNADKYISAYPFENYNQTIKRHIRSKNRPLQQVIRRLAEKESFPVKEILEKDENLFLPYSGGPLAGISNVTEYKKFVGDSFVISLADKDSGVVLKDGKIGRVRNILKCPDKDIKFVTQLFASYNSFYMYPLPSCELGIFCVENLCQTFSVYSLRDIKKKCLLLPLSNQEFVAVPIIHT